MIDIAKITNSKPLTDTKKASKSSHPASTSFYSVLSGAGEVETASSAAPLVEINPIDNIFLVQEVDDINQHTKRKMIKRAETLLERLEDIRYSLLSGSISKQELISAAQFVRNRKETLNDPLLLEIIEQLELRLEIELAKLTL